MLVSMFISLLSAGKFRKDKYVLLMAIAIGLTSFLSVGFPSFFAYSQSIYHNQIILVRIENPLPLSFPLYSAISIHPGEVEIAPGLGIPYYEIYFLTAKLSVLGSYPTVGRFILAYTFFLLINLVGAIFGYWISKSTFTERYFVRRKSKTS